MNVSVASRTFDMADQQRFGSLSGDLNPIHVDPVAARRTQAGAVIVHGSHATLWALDELVRAGHALPPIATIKVLFNQFIYPGDRLTLNIVRENDADLRAVIVASGVVVATMVIEWGVPPTTPIRPFSTTPVSVSLPADLSLADMNGCTGLLPPPPGPIQELFPHASAKLGERRVRSLALLSTLVGMVCPGLHSIFADITIKFVDPRIDFGLTFNVDAVDEAFRTVEIAVGGGGILGSVTAFVRHPPVEQQTLVQLSDRIEGRPFAKTTALVIGGSRGLGAVGARLLAAGGARVIITYAVGEADARRVERDISLELGSDVCRILQYDVRKDAKSQLEERLRDVNQLYYFATPRIFRQISHTHSASRFAEFVEFYVTGFHALCLALQVRQAGEIAVFYPSSILVEDRPPGVTEYCMAKAAGEILCNDMNRFMRGLSVTVRRLPRLWTDQTATIAPLESADPADILLPIIKDLHSIGP